MQDSQRPQNRLSRESSPYLLLHATNPVDWYPWGDEAFERARREDKPIFLSVGYSTCYWCHVMERESFSDEAVARRLNEGFVSIKLDREERPDLDEIYMTATQLLTRSGGWPNSLFLTHDLAPFFAGTYFPPEDRHGRAGFPRVLEAILEAWRERRDEVREQAAAVAEAMREQMAGSTATARLPPAALVGTTQAALARRFDPEWGGFGDAPKFPSPSNLCFLLDRARQGEGEAREMLVVTLDRMARGGLQDQLAGGFHRYSTDPEWRVPHFEKMLYDNASLGLLYAEAARALPAREGRDDGAARAEFERVARATFDFVLGELTGEHGAFLSAIDAETDGHEGAYYTWTAGELRAALDGDGDAWRLPAAVYGFDGAPNFERDRYVLHLPQPWHEQARLLGLDEATLRARVDAGRRALLRVRVGRPRPLTDDKVLADWNGLMIAALARGGSLLGEPRYVAAARGAAEFVLAHLRDDAGELLHAWRGGRAHVAAMLDDYAFLIDGLLALHAALGDARWLDEARRLQSEQDRRLWHDDAGGWFSAAAHPHLLVRARSAHDGALPSGNGVAACNLLELHARGGERALREQAERAVRAFGRLIERFPLGHVTLLRALDRLRRGDAAADAPRAAPAPAGLEAQACDLVAVEATFDARARGAWKLLRVELSVREGWHVNANPASHPFLVATRVSGVGLRGVRYPPGRELRSGVAPEALCVYDGRVTIEGEIEAGAGGVAPLEVTFQPCDAGRCLPAVTLHVTPQPARA